ncbi:hypothetical protein [Saccharothrix sp. HUAS TT1]|uniref:lipase/acyltransferase domain-containing protein n=1 Tax=unclassified Saccharothrix TaxID=2593673 RepID=UPI00345C2C75
MKRRLHDVVVVVPGITGSTLSRRGKVIWAPTHRLAAESVLRPEALAQALRSGDGDGITADGLMPDAKLVGGLKKVDGYTRLIDALANNFDVRRVNTARPGELPPANLIEFPYDWRLDNRVNARRLGEVAERALGRWQVHTGIPDARLVIIAHSMGGLVARYFLEVLEGWKLCRALITLGTPFRGSLDSLGYLANGYKKLRVDLTDTMRTFPSVYQLLPIYKAIHSATGAHRVTEAGDIAGIDGELAVSGLAFHREIEAAVAANDLVDPHRYALLPVVGTHQTTMQSAVLEGGTLALRPDVGDGVDRYFGDGLKDGDGTVPISSASPIDQSNTYFDVYHPEKHGSLQCNPEVLNTLVGRLAKMQARQLEKLRGPEPQVDPGLEGTSLEIDDEYGVGEPVTITAVVHCAAEPADVIAEVVEVATGKTDTAVLSRSGHEWSTTMGGLRPGTYRVTVRARGNGRFPPDIHDLFEVVDE